MKNFPFLSLSQSLTLLRICVPMFFMAHAIVRISNGTIEQFAGFLSHKGFVGATAMVWGITVFEIVGGLALMFGYFTKWLSLGFILMLIFGILIIHAQLGWFVGEHGTGGMEYSVALILALVVIGASEEKMMLKQA
jgi:putative oxidoreductase